MNCYEILGIIHATYKPIPRPLQRLHRHAEAEYVPIPSHLDRFGDGNIYEVQIRTEEMDEIAETGIAAHWRYKEGEHYNAKEEQRDIEEKLHWFRDFVRCRAKTKRARPRTTWPPFQQRYLQRERLCFHAFGQGHRPPDGRDHPRFRLQNPHQSRRFGGRVRSSMARWCRSTPSSRRAMSAKSAPARPQAAPTKAGSISPRPQRQIPHQEIPDQEKRRPRPRGQHPERPRERDRELRFKPGYRRGRDGKTPRPAEGFRILACPRSR
jgi:hypothetical protein